MKKGGFDVFEGLPDRETCARLLGEARQRAATAKPSEIPFADNEEVRGGQPARRFLSASGGAMQTEFYQHGGLARFLETICNAAIVPSGAQGTYTYYARQGDHLALHRDIETCDVSVITCLLDHHEPASTGSCTRLYPSRQNEPLSMIRAYPDCGAVNVRLAPGQTMVVFGGMVPHLITPLGAGERRIVSVLCFRARVEDRGRRDGSRT